MNINYCVLEVVENGGLLVVYDFGGTFSLGYVAGFLIFRKKIIADNGLLNLYSLVEYMYVLLILEFTI